MGSREYEPPPRIRIVLDLDYEPHVYINDVPVPGSPFVEILTGDCRRHGNPGVQLTFHNPEIEIQYVDPSERLDLRGRPNLIDGLPPMDWPVKE